MIDIQYLKPSDIGRQVEYAPYKGKIQRGVITSYNKTFVFVDYDGTGRGQATPPELLTFVKDNTTQGAFNRLGQALKDFRDAFWEWIK
jgi:hypothetical protein